jgi:hypothetical protein
MSRLIENDHRWDDDEIAYMESRGRLEDIKQNREQFAEGDEETDVTDQKEKELKLDQDIFEQVKDATPAKVKTDLKKAGLQQGGTDSETRARLAQYLQNERDRANANT